MAFDCTIRLPSDSSWNLLLQIGDAVTAAFIDLGLKHTRGGVGFGRTNCDFETADRLIDIEISARPHFGPAKQGDHND